MVGKVYPATAINEITKEALVFSDENGNQQSIDLINCRDNWYYKYNKRETAISKILQHRKKCKYIGDRYWGHNEAYIVFYSDIKIKFLFGINGSVELDEACEARQYFGYIKEKLSKVGWVTFDIG